MNAEKDIVSASGGSLGPASEAGVAEGLHYSTGLSYIFFFSKKQKRAMYPAVRIVIMTQ
jgi:hypothetical protein